MLNAFGDIIQTLPLTFSLAFMRGIPMVADNIILTHVGGFVQLTILRPGSLHYTRDASCSETGITSALSEFPYLVLNH